MVEDLEPVAITSKRGNAVLVSEDDWRSIQETLFLLSVPGLRESVREGMATPAEDGSDVAGAGTSGEKELVSQGLAGVGGGQRDECV